MCEQCHYSVPGQIINPCCSCWFGVWVHRNPPRKDCCFIVTKENRVNREGRETKRKAGRELPRKCRGADKSLPRAVWERTPPACLYVSAVCFIEFDFLSFFSFSFSKFFFFFYSVQRYIFPLDCLFLPRHLLCCSETLARSRAYSTGTNPFSMRWSRWRRTDDRVMAEMRRDGRDFEEVWEENKNKRNHKIEVGIGDMTEENGAVLRDMDLLKLSGHWAALIRCPVNGAPTSSLCTVIKKSLDRCIPNSIFIYVPSPYVDMSSLSASEWSLFTTFRSKLSGGDKNPCLSIESNDPGVNAECKQNPDLSQFKRDLWPVEKE